MAARVKYGAMITELKGSVGGQTFQSCRGGFIIRNKPITPKVRSRVQSVIRTVTGNLASSWRALSQADRDTWDAVAPSYPHTDKFGDPATLTGYELYIRANFYLSLAGVSTISVGQLPDVLWNPTGLIITSSEATSTMDLNWLGGAVGAGMRAIIRLSPPMSAGRSYRKSDLITVASLIAGTASPYDLWKACEDNFGRSPVAGEQFFASIQVVSTSTGHASQLYNASAIVQV